MEEAEEAQKELSLLLDSRRRCSSESTLDALANVREPDEPPAADHDDDSAAASSAGEQLAASKSFASRKPPVAAKLVITKSLGSGSLNPSPVGSASSNIERSASFNGRLPSRPGSPLLSPPGLPPGLPAGLPLGINPMELAGPNISSSLQHFVELAIETREHPGGQKEFQRLRDMVSTAAGSSNGGSSKGVGAISRSASLKGISDTDVAMQVVELLLLKVGGQPGKQQQQLGAAAEEDVPQTEANLLAPRVVMSSSAALLAADLLPWLPCHISLAEMTSPRTRMAEGLHSMLIACTRNRAVCSQAGLLKSLLLVAETIFLRAAPNESDFEAAAEESPDDFAFNNAGARKAQQQMNGSAAGGNAAEGAATSGEEWDATPLLRSIEALISHSFHVSDFRCWQKVVAETTRCGRGVDLVLALERAMMGEDTRSPVHTFEFDGDSSGLLGPGDAKWPFGSGYAFVTWVYIESFQDTEGSSVGAASMGCCNRCRGECQGHKELRVVGSSSGQCPRRGGHGAHAAAFSALSPPSHRGALRHTSTSSFLLLRFRVHGAKRARSTLSTHSTQSVGIVSASSTA